MHQQGSKSWAGLFAGGAVCLSSVLTGSFAAAQNTAPTTAKAAVKEAAPTKVAPATKEAAPAKKAAKKPAGRLPVFYADIVSDEQRIKIYDIQASYADKIDALAAQIKAIQAQQNSEIEAVLSEDQLAKLKEARDAAAARRKEKMATTSTSASTKKAAAE